MIHCRSDLIGTILSLEVSYRLRCITLQLNGPFPGKLHGMPGGDILRCLVDPHVLIPMIRPIGSEDLVGLPSQKKIVWPSHLLVNNFAHEFIKMGDRPSAILETAGHVLLGPTRRLHNAIVTKERTMIFRVSVPL